MGIIETQKRLKKAEARLRELAIEKKNAEERVRQAEVLLQEKRQRLIEQGVLSEGFYDKLTYEQQEAMSSLLDKQQEEQLYLEQEMLLLTDAKADLLEAMLQIEKWQQELMVCEFAVQQEENPIEMGDDDE